MTRRRSLGAILTLRQHLQIAAGALGARLKLSVPPGWLAKPLGLFIPFVREGVEMQFLFDRPYIVDSSKFRSRFWSAMVPFEVGLAATARSFVPRDAADLDTRPALPL